MIKMHLKDQSLFRQQCYINGEWVDADDGGTLDVTNPSGGSVIGTVPNWVQRKLHAPLMRLKLLFRVGENEPPSSVRFV